MRIKVDRDDDALYFRLDDSRIVQSEEVRPGVIFDFDENDQVIIPLSSEISVAFCRVSHRALC